MTHERSTAQQQKAVEQPMGDPYERGMGQQSNPMGEPCMTLGPEL